MADLIQYPVNVKEDIDKLKLAFRAKELLRLEHNNMGKKYRDGDISEQAWRDYLKNDFNPKNRKVCYEVAKLNCKFDYDKVDNEEEYSVVKKNAIASKEYDSCINLKNI